MKLNRINIIYHGYNLLLKFIQPVASAPFIISSHTFNLSCSGKGMTSLLSFEMFKHIKGFMESTGFHVASL